MDVNLMYQLDYIGVSSWEKRQDSDKAELPVYKPDSAQIIPEEFSEDVKALCEYSGITTLSEGMTINVTLQELLKIIPRKRHRTDSYTVLVRYLHEELGVELIIISNKSKKHGN